MNIPVPGSLGLCQTPSLATAGDEKNIKIHKNQKIFFMAAPFSQTCFCFSRECNFHCTHKPVFFLNRWGPFFRIVKGGCYVSQAGVCCYLGLKDLQFWKHQHIKFSLSASILLSVQLCRIGSHLVTFQRIWSLEQKHLERFMYIKKSF